MKPQIKFADFIACDWQEKYLHEVVVKNKLKNVDEKVTYLESISNKYGFVAQAEHFANEQRKLKKVDRYFICYPNVVAYNPSRIDIGSIAVKKTEQVSIISPLYISFYTNPSLNIDFFSYWLQTRYFINWKNQKIMESVMKSLPWKEFETIPIKLPSLEEQAKISGFLQLFDHQISLKEKELDLKQKYKVQMLSKLFVGDNKLIPSLRFAAFKEPSKLQVTKLGDLTNIYDGTHYTPTYQKQGIPFFRAENCQLAYNEVQEFVSYDNYTALSALKKVSKGDLFFTRIGNIANVRVIDFDGPAFYYVTLALIKKCHVDSEYLKYYFASQFFLTELKKYIIDVAFPIKINLKDIGKLPIAFPSLEEQQQIANFFKLLDSEIILLQEELQLYQKQKEYYLQKMFA